MSTTKLSVDCLPIREKCEITGDFPTRYQGVLLDGEKIVWRSPTIVTRPSDAVQDAIAARTVL